MDPDACLRALREHATPLDSAPLGDRTAPNGPRTFPSALARSLADASIVGLGEATHGARECFEHKHRLIRSLVTECGVRTVAFEVDADAATVLDAFVRHGSGLSTAPAEAALPALDMQQCGQRPSVTCSSGSRRPHRACAVGAGPDYPLDRSTTRDHRLAQKGFRRMIAGVRL